MLSSTSIVAALLACVAAAARPPIEWNHDFITARDPSAAPTPMVEGSDPLPASSADFDDPESVARFLLSQLDSANVLPTEQYFYYRFHLGPRHVGGNLRFTEAAEGVLHIGYFDVNDLSDMRYAALNAEDGVLVEALRRPGDPVYRVTIDGQRCDFRVVMKHRDAGAGMQLAKGEQFLSGVLDESGILLTLVFDETTNAFRYLAPPEGVARLSLAPIAVETPHVLVDQQSRFVFYKRAAPEALILVGVLADHVRGNTYFDGAFDQVPPDLDLKPMINAAYPYTKTDRPVDQHGNFLDVSGVRVAISPYMTYERLADIRRLVTAAESAHPADGPERWSALTFEHQRVARYARAAAGWEPISIPAESAPKTLRGVIEFNQQRGPAGADPASPGPR